MVIIILILISGLATGFLIKSRPKLIKFTDYALNISIFVLLFFLGLSIGSNQEIISKFKDIGVVSFLIMLFGVAGTLILSLGFYFLTLNKKVGKGED